MVSYITESSSRLDVCMVTEMKLKDTVLSFKNDLCLKAICINVIFKKKDKLNFFRKWNIFCPKQEKSYLYRSTLPAMTCKETWITLCIWDPKRKKKKKKSDLWMTVKVKSLPVMRETWVQSLAWEDLLREEMAAHSSILAWRIPWTQEPGGLQSTGLQRIGHDWVTNTHIWLFATPWLRFSRRQQKLLNFGRRALYTIIR